MKKVRAGTRRRAAWILLISLCVIACAVSLRRGIALAYPPASYPVPDLAALDARFAAEPRLTYAHIIPAFVFAVLVPFQFAGWIRERHPAFHRWSGRVLIGVGTMAGLTAVFLSRHPIGGWFESAATLTFDALFLFLLWTAFRMIRRRELARHREWMLRAVAIALGVATVQPVMGIFFATSRLTHLTPHQFFGWAFWIGFIMNLTAIEIWIRRTRGATRFAWLPASRHDPRPIDTCAQHLAAYFAATAFSIAAITSGESGVVAGSKRATTLPSRSTRNLVKFH